MVLFERLQVRGKIQWPGNVPLSTAAHRKSGGTGSLHVKYIDFPHFSKWVNFVPSAALQLSDLPWGPQHKQVKHRQGKHENCFLLWRGWGRRLAGLVHWVQRDHLQGFQSCCPSLQQWAAMKIHDGGGKGRGETEKKKGKRKGVKTVLQLSCPHW